MSNYSDYFFKIQDFDLTVQAYRRIAVVNSSRVKKESSQRIKDKVFRQCIMNDDIKIINSILNFKYCPSYFMVL